MPRDLEQEERPATQATLICWTPTPKVTPMEATLERRSAIETAAEEVVAMMMVRMTTSLAQSRLTRRSRRSQETLRDKLRMTKRSDTCFFKERGRLLRISKVREILKAIAASLLRRERSREPLTVRIPRMLQP